MESRPILRLYWILQWLLVHKLPCNGDEWLQRPGILNVCVGNDVSFRWHYNQTDSEPVTMVLWLYLGTEQSMMAWYQKDNKTKAYPGYEGRVEPLPNTNAGMILKKVSKTDSDRYQVELSGPGSRDVATLNVYSVEELRPILQLDNEDIAFGSVVDKSNQSIATLSIATLKDVNANIDITIDGAETATCTDKGVCTAVIVFSEVPAFNITAHVSVDYNICEPFKDVVYIVTKEAAQYVGTSGAGVTVACVLVFLVLPLLTIIVLVIVWFVLRKKQKKGTRLSAGQRQYVECAVLYQLTRCPGWGPEDVKSDPDPEGTVTTPLSVNEDYYKEDGDTVEIPDSAVQNMPPTDIRKKKFLDKAKDKITSVPSRISNFFQPGDTAAVVPESRDDNEKTNIPNQKDTETTEDTSQIPGASVELPSKSTKDVTDPDQVAAPVGHVSITKDKKKQRKEEARRLAAEIKEQDNKSGNDVYQGSTSDGNASCGGKETSSEDKGATEERDSKKGAEKSTHETFKEAQANKTLVNYGAAGGIV